MIVLVLVLVSEVASLDLSIVVSGLGLGLGLGWSGLVCQPHMLFMALWTETSFPALNMVVE